MNIRNESNSLSDLRETGLNISTAQENRMIPMGLDLKPRVKTNLLPEINAVGSLHLESNFINTTDRSFGMPQGSSEDVFSKLQTRGAIQISSTSANDTVAGSRARRVSISGLHLDNNLDWLQISEDLELDGQTPVVSVGTTWWRINNIFVTECGVSGQINASNEGDLYISPAGQSLTNGVPDANVIGAMLATFNNSSMGDFSIGTNEVMIFYRGNFWTSGNKDIVIREQYRQGFGGDGINDLMQYQVAQFPSVTTGFDYGGNRKTRINNPRLPQWNLKDSASIPILCC